MPFVEDLGIEQVASQPKGVKDFGILPAAELPPETEQREGPEKLFQRFLGAVSATDAHDIFGQLMKAASSLESRGMLRKSRARQGFPYQTLAGIPGLPWRARSVWALLDARVKSEEYRSVSLAGRQVVVCGAGPCGLRAALELALLRAEVTVVEKRPMGDAFTRISRLHLWQWCKQDLLAWGAKVFDPPGGTFGGDNDFCHIGISELQSVLFKNALLLGVRFKFETEATGANGTSVLCKHGARLPCEAFILADGAKSKLSQAFGLNPRPAGLRGKGSAIGVVANFVNSREPDQMSLRQFAWARQFNQPLFAELRHRTGVDLENIVYYKGSAVHYLVATPTKQCLLSNGVLIDPNPRTELLDKENVNSEKLASMLQKVAEFFGLPTKFYHTQGAMIFDFSDVRRLEHAAQVSTEGLFVCAVGDALLEPFWPEGLGIIRGFMSALDAATAVRDALCSSKEAGLSSATSSYNVLKSVSAQTAAQCLQKDPMRYRLTPESRYIFSARS